MCWAALSESSFLCSGSHTSLAFDPSRVIPEHTNHNHVHVTRREVSSRSRRRRSRREIILAVLVGDNGGRSVAMAECPAGVSAKRIPLALEWPTVRKYRRETLNNERTVIAAPRPIIFTVQVLLCHGDRS